MILERKSTTGIVYEQAYLYYCSSSSGTCSSSNARHHCNLISLLNLQRFCNAKQRPTFGQLFFIFLHIFVHLCILHSQQSKSICIRDQNNFLTIIETAIRRLFITVLLSGSPKGNKNGSLRYMAVQLNPRSFTRTRSCI